MPKRGRWDSCVEHRGEDVAEFIQGYFAQPDRRCLLIAGAGFDPRSSVLPRLLGPTLANRLVALLLKEERPNPPASLVQRAATNLSHLQATLAATKTLSFHVFGEKNAAIGGRNVVKTVHACADFTGITDVVVDLSALSVGTGFPLVRYVRERVMAEPEPRNFHIMVAADSDLDATIVPIASDTVGFIHGFRGRVGLDAQGQAAKLWLPQLALGYRATLQRVHQFLGPHDTCPILPFPAANPRASDELLEHYLTELESTWDVEPRNVVYAAENNPLDLYRTLLRIDDVRQEVFRETGGSLLILSPAGSKILAIGGLLAALERDLPIAYVEPIGYDCRWPDPVPASRPELLHIWLEGEVYPDRGQHAEPHP